MSKNRILAGAILFFLIVTCLNAQEKVQPKLMLTVGHAGELIDADFSPDGTRVVSASFDNDDVNHIIVWDVLSGNIITIIEDDQEVLFTGEGNFCNINVAFSRSGNRIITTDKEDSFTIWDASNGEKIFHSDGYHKVILNERKDKIITFSADSYPYTDNEISIKVWDAETVTLLNEDNITLQKTDLNKSHYYTFDLNFNDPFVIGTYKNTFILWNTDLKHVFDEKSIHEDEIKGHIFSSDSKHLVTYTNKDICIWDLVKFKLVKKFNPGFFSDSRVLISDDNRKLIFYNNYFINSETEEKINLSIYELITGDLIDEIQDVGLNEFIDIYYKKSSFSDIFPELINDLGINYPFENASFIDEIADSNSNGKIMFRGDSIVELWDGESLHSYHSDDQTKFNTLKYSLDGRHVLLYDNEAYHYSSRKIVVLDAKNLDLITTLEGKVNQSVRSWLTSSGKRLFIETEKSYNIWNTEAGKILYTIPFTNHLYFTNDESKLAVITEKRIEIRDVNEGKLLTYIDNIDVERDPSRARYGRKLIFSNDGSLIAIIKDEAIEIRDANTGKLLNFTNTRDIQVFHNSSTDIVKITFSKDNLRFAIQTFKGVEVRDVNTGKLLMYVKAISGRKYGEATFTNDGQMIAYPYNEVIDIIDVEM